MSFLSSLFPVPGLQSPFASSSSATNNGVNIVGASGGSSADLARLINLTQGGPEFAGGYQLGGTSDYQGLSRGSATVSIPPIAIFAVVGALVVFLVMRKG